MESCDFDNHILPEIELFFMFTFQMKAVKPAIKVTMRLSAAGTATR